MGQQTTTLAIESNVEPTVIFVFLSDVVNIPKWSPVFADEVERIDEFRCLATKSGTSFEFEIHKNEGARTVDYIRQMSGGKSGGAFIRVTHRPLGGSSISMTVPVATNATVDDVTRVLRQELNELVRLTQSS
jgi:hypothetical protein